MGRPKGSKNRPKPEPVTAGPPATVVIPHLTDPFLPGTVRDILATAPGVEIIVVQDGTQRDPDVPAGVRVLKPWADRRGVGPCRDAAIAAATSEVIVTMDAHTRPLPGWLEGMLAVLRMPGAIACAQAGLCSGASTGRWSDPSRYCTGARILHQTPYGYPLEPDWLQGVAAGEEVPCALGGTYAFRKDRYQAIGCPWRQAIGWGSSEQTLCMVNWFLGGQTVIADAKADHIIYGRINGRPEPKPFQPSDHMAAGAYFNRVRLIDILPMSSEEREQLTGALYFHAHRYADAVRKLIQNRIRDEAKDAMALASRTWEDWCTRWWQASDMVYIQPKRDAPQPPPPHAVPRKVGRRVIGARPPSEVPGYSGIPTVQPQGRVWL